MLFMLIEKDIELRAREREETAILFGYKIHLHHKAPENTFTKVL